MLRVKRFINDQMESNCYVVFDEKSGKCVVIDPGSERSIQVISFINSLDLSLDFIILTHEHTDHNLGVNALRDCYTNSKLVCSEECSRVIQKTNRAFFLLYYDNPNCQYQISPADILINSEQDTLQWNGIVFLFFITPGHSKASMCIDIDGMLFTGDTIMPFPRYLNRKDGNEEDWKKSIGLIESIYSKETIIYPGHGDTLTLGMWIDSNK